MATYESNATIASLNDYQLFRACGPLYPAFAVESLTSLLLGFFFCYLSLRIAVRSDVPKPMFTFVRMIYGWAQPVVSEWWGEVQNWSTMNQAPLAKRMAICRQLNLAMCMAQATAAFITVTRWLHIDNVNGFRYLGYAFTCSLMQAELVVLIAPYVPCYSMNAVGIVLLTHTWMVLGWIGSMHEGFLFEDASWNMFLESGQVSELQVTTKGIFIGITAAGLCSLLFLQMPFLAMIYFCNGGLKNEDMPPHYLKLMATVWFTWPAFPGWWILSAEGLGVFGEATSNAVGFAVLNIISKGTFTFVMLGIGKTHKVRTSRKLSQSSGDGSQDLSQNSQAPPNWLVKSLQNFERTTSEITEAERTARQMVKEKQAERQRSAELETKQVVVLKEENDKPAEAEAGQGAEEPAKRCETWL